MQTPLGKMGLCVELLPARSCTRTSRPPPEAWMRQCSLRKFRSSRRQVRPGATFHMHCIPPPPPTRTLT